MPPCKHCDEPTITFHLTSNDSRMTGYYCRRSHIDDRRASLPRLEDPRYKVTVDEELEEVVVFKPIEEKEKEPEEIPGWENFFE